MLPRARGNKDPGSIYKPVHNVDNSVDKYGDKLLVDGDKLLVIGDKFLAGVEKPWAAFGH